MFNAVLLLMILGIYTINSLGVSKGVATFTAAANLFDQQVDFRNFSDV